MNKDPNEVARDFLSAAKNTVTRERMYFSRLYFELKFAAARRNNPLKIFEPDVDRSGFDVILDDGDQERRFQLKIVGDGVGTSSWTVHKRLLRPAYRIGALAGWSPASCGFGGALLVLKISLANHAVPFHYLYTDWFVISCLSEGLIRQRGKNSEKKQNEAAIFLAELYQGIGPDRMTVPSSLCLQPRDADSLLAIGGFHNCLRVKDVPVYQLFGNFMKLYEKSAKIVDGFELSKPDVQLAASLEIAAKQLLGTVDSQKLVGFTIPSSLIKEQPESSTGVVE